LYIVLLILICIHVYIFTYFSFTYHIPSNPSLPPPYSLFQPSYYVFDTANSQKAHTKIPGITRNTFPQLPWGVLSQPQYLKTPAGNLLVDGWYMFVRKIQYTGDIVMALAWGLACGFGSSLPYFYCVFFTCMINHRQGRDEVKCSSKYGKHWNRYKDMVPNVFLPGLYAFLLHRPRPHSPTTLPLILISLPPCCLFLLSH
jgi:delta24(24(1))-sterol reductase